MKGAEIEMNSIKIDMEQYVIQVDNHQEIPLYSPEGFKLISDIWLKVGWDQKYMYTFTWFGRPIIQVPDDMVRIQEIIYAIKPDLIIETGIAHGGSLIFYASLCKAMEKGRILGVDIEIRPHNREAIENHELSGLVAMVEGSSIGEKTLEKVQDHIREEDEVILVILDSAHDYPHVLGELKAYSKFVSIGSYIVVTDGSQKSMGITQRAKTDYPEYHKTWETNNPLKAAEKFVAMNAGFQFSEPVFKFNESDLDFHVTNWPSAYIKRVK
jgi:cephalosporin hydroxylase